MISRRKFLKGLLALSASSVAIGGYALAEPFRLNITRYQLTPRGWPPTCRLKVAVIADIHVCEPWMGLEKLRRIVARTNALGPDIILLLGDYVASQGIRRYGRNVGYEDWGPVLAKLSAPLGVHGVMGNHDWWDDPRLVAARAGTPRAATELTKHGITVLENDCLRLTHQGHPFWLAGLGSQTAFWLTGKERAAAGKRKFFGTDDLAGTLAKVADDAPILMMAHEPDIFPQIPRRVALTMSGHTHGGQVRLFGHSPIVPSSFGNRYAYGHVYEDNRHLIVSGGLGCSIVPVRFGVPPEIVMIELGDRET